MLHALKSGNKVLAVLGFLAFILMSVIYVTLNYKHSYIYGMTADSAIYILMADAFSPYFSSDHGLYHFLIEKYPFPPFFPFVLAIVGGGIKSPLVSYLSSSVILILALGVYYQWSRLILSSRASALSLVVLFAFMPNTLRQLMVIESEHLYLLLTISGFLLLKRAKSDGQYYLAGLLFSLGSITRTIGLVALLIYSIKLWPRYAIRKYVLLIVTLFVPVLVWTIYKSQYSESHGYLAILSAGLEGNVLENIISQVDVNLQLMWLYWVRCFDTHIASYSRYVVALVTFIMSTGLLLRLTRREPDALYISGYLLILLVWPYPAQFERFLYILMPFALVYGVYAMGRCQIYVSKAMTDLSSYGYVAAIMLVMLPTILGMWVRFDNGDSATGDAVRSIDWLQSRDSEKTQGNQEFLGRIYEFMQNAGEVVPEDACIVSTVPAYLMLHSGRKSIKPAPYTSSDADFNRSLKACDYVLMVAVIPRPNIGNPAMYPFHRIKETMQVFDVIYVEPGNSGGYVAAMLVRHGF